MAERRHFPVRLCLLVVSAFACGSATAPPPPPPAVVLTARHGHAMAYDEARHQLLLFGGTGTEGTAPSGDRNSLWSWNGQLWTRLSTTGPTPRYLASMVYDAGRQRIVLFGGQTGVFPNIAVLNDTWEWDGSTWTQKAPAAAGPGVRVHQVMAYDRVRGKVVLYGGFNGVLGEIQDIWEWNGTVWTLLPVSTAADLAGRAIGFDEKAGVLYLYSVVFPATTVLIDILNGATLTRSPLPGPGCVPPHPQLAALGAVRGGLLFYAGTCGPAENTPATWRWDGTTWSSVGGAQPPFRINAAMAYDRDRDRVVLFGGEVAPGVPDVDETWEFDGTSWIKR